MFLFSLLQVAIMGYTRVSRVDLNDDSYYADDSSGSSSSW